MIPDVWSRSQAQSVILEQDIKTYSPKKGETYGEGLGSDGCTDDLRGETQSGKLPRLPRPAVPPPICSRSGGSLWVIPGESSCRIVSQARLCYYFLRSCQQRAPWGADPPSIADNLSGPLSQSARCERLSRSIGLMLGPAGSQLILVLCFKHICF